MKNNQMKYMYRLLCTVILTSLSTGSFAYMWYGFIEENNQTGHLTGQRNIVMALLIYLVLFLNLGKWLHAFKIGVERKAKIMVSIILTSWITNAIEVLISMAITGQFCFAIVFIHRYTLLSLFQTFILGLIAIPMINIYRKIIPPLRVLEIIGKYNNQLSNKVNAIKYKYQIEKTLTFNELYNLQQEINGYDAVLINDIPAKNENEIVKLCFRMNKRVYIVPKIADIIKKSSTELNIVDTPLFLCRNIRMTTLEKILKRAIDLVFSTLTLVVLSPVFILVAIAIKLEDGGPIFFLQERITLDEKHFLILK